MGKIDYAVQNGILTEHPKLERILRAFLSDFDVNWGGKSTAFNTKLYSFIVKPTDTFAETFGFEYELLLIYSPYDSMQARTMQAINSLFSTDPAKGRVETQVCIVVSDASGAKEWIYAYSTEYQDLRTYVVFNKDALTHQLKNTLISEFRTQLGERDLFDVQLPLLDDLYFFGRKDILNKIQNNIKACENSGIFGLRKTGKTSLLYKIKRTVEASRSGKVFIYDSKNLKIRLRKWTELLLLILKDISREYRLEIIAPDAQDEIRVVEVFEKMISMLQGQQVVIIFDEIEYISFDTTLNTHWKEDFINFWQFLWTMESSYRNLCFVIAGVNPHVIEVSSIDSIQNPLFSIVKPYYIQGLERKDIQNMSRRIGRRLGLKFDNTSIDYLYDRYGGHPLLTRLALSYENKKATSKPVTFTRDVLKTDEDVREEALVPYCQHIVDVLKDFYPDEYMLLEFLAIDDVQDFLELASSPMSDIHLRNYGLLDERMPLIKLPVMKEYIRRVQRREQGGQLMERVIPADQRDAWLQEEILTVIDYMRQLEGVIRKNSLPLLFGVNSFPNADKILNVPVAHTENDFKVFISTFSNCFVESIENYGKSISKSNYFWVDIKSSYPYLFDGLLRIKAYRNRCEHLALNPSMQEYVEKYQREDLEGRNPCDVDEVDFVLQQRTIEKFKLAISLENANLS